MGKLFLMFIFLSAIVSCGGETKETNKCDGVSCNDWEQCNATSGVCEAKSGRCETVQDCLGTNICDANHNCVNPDNPCEGQTCSAHGTCVVENNSAKCNCETGYSADGLTCLEKTCTTGETKSISCGEDGETQSQICENGIWKSQGTCLCLNTSTRRTTCQGDGLQYQTCVDGSWADVGVCINTDCSTAGETRAVGCGFNGNGTQNQVCVNSKWTNTGTCTDPDDCANGTTQLVSNSTCANQSLNGRGKAEQICANGQWINYEGNCKDPDVCEDDAEQTIEEIPYICSQGQWIVTCSEVVCASELQHCNKRIGECFDLCAYANCDTVTQDCNWQFGTCVAKGDLCATDTTCALQNKVCDASTGIVVCKGDCTIQSCASGLVCNRSTHLCENLCEDVTCCEGRSCNPTNGQCEGFCNLSNIVGVRSEGILISDVNSPTPSIGGVNNIEGIVIALRGTKTSSKHGIYIRQANTKYIIKDYIIFPL